MTLSFLSSSISIDMEYEETEKMAHLSYTKDFPGIADVFLRDPGLYAPLLQFIEGVMTRPSELTKAEREMLAAHVSRHNGCDFCVGAHRWTLAAMEIGWAVVEALEAGPDSEEFSPRFREMLRFATRLTEAPGRIGKADIDARTAAGWSEQAVEDAINVIALFNYVNRVAVTSRGAQLGTLTRPDNRSVARRGGRSVFRVQ
jgi:uncharacterized peroxidase-related enzyme